MTEKIERLRAVLRDEGPTTARTSARHLAIEKAMLAFDEKNPPATKGTRVWDRLKGTAIAVSETLVGRRPMKLTHALAGGASFSVLLVAILSTQYVHTNDIDSQPIFETPVSSPPTQAAEPKESDKLALNKNRGSRIGAEFWLRRELPRTGLLMPIVLLMGRPLLPYPRFHNPHPEWSCGQWGACTKGLTKVDKASATIRIKVEMNSQR